MPHTAAWRRSRARGLCHGPAWGRLVSHGRNETSVACCTGACTPSGVHRSGDTRRDDGPIAARCGGLTRGVHAAGQCSASGGRHRGDRGNTRRCGGAGRALSRLGRTGSSRIGCSYREAQRAGGRRQRCSSPTRRRPCRGATGTRRSAGAHLGGRRRAEDRVGRRAGRDCAHTGGATRTAIPCSSSGATRTEPPRACTATRRTCAQAPRSSRARSSASTRHAEPARQAPSSRGAEGPCVASSPYARATRIQSILTPRIRSRNSWRWRCTRGRDFAATAEPRLALGAALRVDRFS